MRAAVLYDIRDIRLADIPLPQAADDEVLVQVKAVGALYEPGAQAETLPVTVKPVPGTSESKLTWAVAAAARFTTRTIALPKSAM